LQVAAACYDGTYGGDVNDGAALVAAHQSPVSARTANLAAPIQPMRASASGPAAVRSSTERPLVSRPKWSSGLRVSICMSGVPSIMRARFSRSWFIAVERPVFGRQAHAQAAPQAGLRTEAGDDRQVALLRCCVPASRRFPEAC